MATASVTSAALMMAGILRYDSADCGGPMHTVSSASSTCLVLKSAVECTATVLMPSSRHARNMRRAISPRFAMTTFSIIELFDDEQRLTELDRLTVLRQHRRHPASLVRLDLIHHLHGFNDAKYLADFDFAADLHEGLRTRRGGRIVGADHRRGDRVLIITGRTLAGRSGRHGCGGRGRMHDRSRLRGSDLHAHPRVAADAHRLLALRNLQFRDARLLEQLDQFLYLANVHPRTP